MKDKNIYVFYMMDEFTKYMKGRIIKSKAPEQIINNFNAAWIEDGPGPPSKGIFSDRGGEFRNKHMVEFSQNMGLRLYLTAGHSPFSNGSMERNHYSIDLTILKLLEEDKDIDIEDALRKALYAYNTQVRKSGFSPYQLVYGKQFSFPGIVDGNPASDEPIEKDAIRQQMVQRVKAEDMYRQYEESDKIKRFLAQKARAYEDYSFREGEEFIYKEDGKTKWSGPAKIISIDNIKIKVSHDGYARTVHKSKVMPLADSPIYDATDENEEHNEEEGQNDATGNQDVIQTIQCSSKLCKIDQ